MFFFQAEDGIRDLTVTGVQTCALPIPAFASRRWSPWCSRASSCCSTRRRFRTPSRCPSITCSIPPITTAIAAAPRSPARSWSFARSPSGIATSGAPPPGCSSPSIGCASDLPMSDAERALGALLALMPRLRDPQRGCPWDREQTFSSIAPYTIEEAYEVADAIEPGEREPLRDELGDLLFQAVFHARMAEG